MGNKKNCAPDYFLLFLCAAGFGLETVVDISRGGNGNDSGGKLGSDISGSV
jgi:hypothetical protein